MEPTGPVEGFQAIQPGLIVLGIRYKLLAKSSLWPDAVAVVGVMPAAAISLPLAQSRRLSGIELCMRFDGRDIAVRHYRAHRSS